MIRTPDQRLRVFVSSTLEELAPERVVARSAVESLRMVPVMFELGARPHPPRDLYRAYLEQSHVFVGLYWQRYGWVAPDMDVSGLEDEYVLAAAHPKLLYLKEPADAREPRLDDLLDRIRDDGDTSYRRFGSVDELRELLENDLALLLTERFETSSEPHPPSERASLSAAHLPSPPGRLIGRSVETAGAAELLRRDDVRMVVLVGAGGAGKTRLALHLAGHLERSFPDGVWFVDLSGIRDPALVLPTLAGALGVRQSNNRTLIEALGQVFGGRQPLVVLDNFEQVLGAAPDLSDLLGATDGLKLLVTSRQPLHLRWEHDYPVLPLGLPGAEAAAGPDAVEASPAVELFVEAARRVRPTFRVDHTNATVVAEICHRLDGLPLALELAAARLRLLTPQDLLAHLDAGLDALDGGTADAPERHHALRRTIDWSHELLSPAEQALFRRLAVFAGGCSLDAVESVCQGGEVAAPDLLDLLETLVDQSLLVSEADVSVAPTRFRMLETIREYGLERLEESGEAPAVRGRYLDWAVELLDHPIESFWTSEMSSWLAVFERELDNLRVALDEAGATGRWDDGLRAASQWLLWDTGSQMREGQERLRSLLEMVPAGTVAPSVAQGRMALGWLTALLGDFDGAIALIRDGVAGWRTLDDPLNLGWALVMTGNVAFNLELTEEADALFQEGGAIGRRVGSEPLVGWEEFGLAHVALLRGDMEGARSLLASGLVRAERQGVPWAIAWVRFSSAVIHLLEAEYDAARVDVVESLRQRWTVRDGRGLSDSITLLACLDSSSGDDDWALLLHGAAEVLRESTGLTVLPWLRDLVDTNVAALRERVDPGHFERQWHEGRSRPLEKVVTEALEERAAPAPPGIST